MATVAAALCISCRVEPVQTGGATCRACARARAERARDSVRGSTQMAADPVHVVPAGSVTGLPAALGGLDDLPEPSPGALAEIESAEDGCDIPGYNISGDVTPGAPDRLWQCDCGRTFTTAKGLGGHRGHGCGPGTRASRQPTGTLPSHERLYELVDLAVGWSCLTESQRQCAMAVGQLPPGDLALVVGIAGRFASRTTRLFDELRRGD